MSLPEFIQRVVDSGLLAPDLTRIPSQGASSEQIASYEIPQDLQTLLRWRNGIDLEVVRIHGIPPLEQQLPPIESVPDSEQLVIASDPAGFQYRLGKHDQIVLWDHDGGSTKQVASNISDFLMQYVFGSRSSEFGGEEWLREVNEHLSDD